MKFSTPSIFWMVALVAATLSPNSVVVSAARPLLDLPSPEGGHLTLFGLNRTEPLTRIAHKYRAHLLLYNNISWLIDSIRFSFDLYLT